MILDRKKDAHQKIQLGGLLIKAGHQYTDKAVLLAALIELKPKLVPGSPEFLRLKEMGNAAFKSEPKSNSSENSS
jgi:hypothetical protein